MASPRSPQTPSGAAEEADYYALLGITIDSTPKEIATAYRRKALVVHPDKNPDNPKAGTSPLPPPPHRLTALITMRRTSTRRFPSRPRTPRRLPAPARRPRSDTADTARAPFSGALP